MFGYRRCFYPMWRKAEFNFSQKTKPYPHQYEAIEFMKGDKNIPLFDEQGLGKSKIVIDTLCSDIEKKIIDSALIICKKTLLDMWKKEISKHSHLSATVLGGTARKRGRSFMYFSHFYIINYESLIPELERIKMFLNLRKFAVVLDESHKIKNPESKITRSILEIRNLAAKRIIITGTPIANRPEDLWSQFYFLDDGKTLGVSFKDFKDQFKVNLRGTDLKEYEKNLEILRERIDKISIRRTKDVLELPEKRYFDVSVELADRQGQIYDRLKEELYLEIKDTDGRSILEKIDNYLVKLLRLTQIASNPALIDEGYQETPAKFIKLDELVKEIIERGEKVIIWTSFRKNIRVLRGRYQKYGALMLFGEIPIVDRNEIVEKFVDNDSFKVLVANPSAAKEGLTLTSANNAIYLDRSFKMDDYLQSQDRIHRISQERKCNIIKMIARNTIDEYTDDILEKKHLIAQYTLGDIENVESERKFLNKQDLLEILG